MHLSPSCCPSIRQPTAAGLTPRLAFLLCLLSVVTLVRAAALDGEYHATIDGVPTVMTLSATGTSVSGSYREGNLDFDVQGELAGQRLSGKLLLPGGSGVAIASFDGQQQGGQLTLRIVATHPLGGQSRTVDTVFSRTGADTDGVRATAPPGRGKTDPKLVGRWVHEHHINSDGSNFAGFSTVRTMEFGADGSARQTSASAGGGSDWSYGSGGAETVFDGQWQTADGVLYLRAAGQADFVAAARYRFADPYLITEDAGNGRLNWQRAR